MRKSDSIALLAADFAKASAEFSNVIADTPGQIGHQQYLYATLGQVVDMARPILGKYNLSIIQGPVLNGNGDFVLESLILHASGEWIETAVYPLVVDVPQSMGKAITYGRRYCWSSLLGIAAEKDMDADGVDIPLGMRKGNGPTRHASHPLFDHLKMEMHEHSDLDDLDAWWKKKQASVKRLNSEDGQFLFIEFMKHGFRLAPTPGALRTFGESHKPGMDLLRQRSEKEWEGVGDFYAQARQDLAEDEYIDEEEQDGKTV